MSESQSLKSQVWDVAKVLLFVFGIFGGIHVLQLGGRAASDPFWKTRFDRETWLEFANSEEMLENPRGGMVTDLRRYHLTVGMSSAEVIQLLGEPEFRTPGLLRYTLGATSGFRIDGDTLDISVSKDGKVTRIRCVQH